MSAGKPVCRPMRLVAGLVALGASLAPSFAAAQAWTVQGGVAARGEYNDNYFFTQLNEESAFTATVSPFVAAMRRTEASQVTALLSVGVNDVSGPTLSSDTYAGGSFNLDGAWRQATSLWTAQASFQRSPRLESERTPGGTILGLVNTNTAYLSAGYDYTLSERWTLGATLGGYDNRYDSLESGEEDLPSNHGYNVGGKASYALSDRTQLAIAPVYGRFKSDITRSDYTTVVLSLTHQFSPQFEMSASAGGFRSEIEETQTGARRTDDGHLYGGSLGYALSERTRLAANLSENLSPSAIGTITASRYANASLTHRFSDRLTAQLGVGYERTVAPESLSGSTKTTYYRGEAGAAYLFSELWRLEVGYRYGKATYSQDNTEPRSNVAFVSIGYNWPGASMTDQAGKSQEPSGLPGAGPQSIRPAQPGPFDRYSIP